MTRAQRDAELKAEEDAARRRGRDALRADLDAAVERMVDAFNYDNGEWHGELGCCDPIRARIVRAPGEHDRDASLALRMEVHTNAGLALRLGIARKTAQLVLERTWLPDGRPLRYRLFDRIERTEDGRDAVLTGSGGNALSLLAEFEAIARRVLDPQAARTPAHTRCRGRTLCVGVAAGTYVRYALPAKPEVAL